MARLLVCACAKHDLRKIEEAATEEQVEQRLRGPVKGYWDVNASMQRLAMTKAGTVQRLLETRRWCALCPGLARWECATTPEMPFQRMESDRRRMLPREGCGLRLCEACVVVFGDVHKGNLDGTVKDMEEVVMVKPLRSFWPLGLRADYDFFGKDSFLVRQCLSNWK